MRYAVRFGSAVLAIVALLAACDAETPADPVENAAFAVGGGGRHILMLDNCDPESFNGAVGPGTCVNRNGGLSFSTFIKILEKQQAVASWRFSPAVIHVAKEMTLPIVNAGGEVHTFTEVEEFGGGIVAELNELTGLHEIAPECLALTGADFILPGGHTTHNFEPGESDKYMCCIHPWMRAEAR